MKANFTDETMCPLHNAPRFIVRWGSSDIEYLCLWCLLVDMRKRCAEAARFTEAPPNSDYWKGRKDAALEVLAVKLHEVKRLS